MSETSLYSCARACMCRQGSGAFLLCKLWAFRQEQSEDNRLAEPNRVYANMPRTRETSTSQSTRMPRMLACMSRCTVLM